MAKKEKQEIKIGDGELSDIANLLYRKQEIQAELKEIDAKMKPLVEAANKIYDGKIIRAKNGMDLFFETVRRIAPKYKEICFELADPAKITELVDSGDDKFVAKTVSYQCHFPKPAEEDEQK